MEKIMTKKLTPTPMLDRIRRRAAAGASPEAQETAEHEIAAHRPPEPDTPEPQISKPRPPGQANTVSPKPKSPSEPGLAYLGDAKQSDKDRVTTDDPIVNLPTEPMPRAAATADLKEAHTPSEEDPKPAIEPPMPPEVDVSGAEAEPWRGLESLLKQVEAAMAERIYPGDGALIHIEGGIEKIRRGRRVIVEWMNEHPEIFGEELISSFRKWCQ